MTVLASKNNNIFMVGDEDQSIYGFAGAYPEALLNFRDLYTNPFIIKLEKNYRSTTQIVDVSKKFIDSNIKRNPKNMESVKGNGSDVQIVDVNSLSEELSVAVSAAEHLGNQMAILYRENSSAIPFIVALEKQHIPFQLIAERTEYDFLASSNIKKVIGFLKLIDNPKYVEAIWDLQYCIYNQLYPGLINKAINLVKQNDQESVISAIEKVFTNPTIRNNINKLGTCLAKAQNSSVNDAITIAGNYCVSSSAQRSKVMEILNSILNEGDTVQSLLNTINTVQERVSSSHNDKNGVYLSTFHSAKGLEFNSVYIVDVYDGVCPNTSIELRRLYEEERRLFYVAMTRAKNELLFFRNTCKTTAFIDELSSRDSSTNQTDNSEEIKPQIEGTALTLLWKPYYSTIIVTDTETKQDMIIHGSNGKMRTSYGKIVGQYTKRTYNGYYYSKEYSITSANRPIWLRKRATVDKSFPPIKGCATVQDLLVTKGSGAIIECVATGFHYLIMIDVSSNSNLKSFRASRINEETGEPIMNTHFEVEEAAALKIWRLANN